MEVEKFESSIKERDASHGIIKKKADSNNIELIFYKNREVFREVIEVNDQTASFLFEFWAIKGQIEFKKWPL